MSASSGAIRAGQAFVELFADDSKLVKGLRSAQARLGAWSRTVSAMGLGLKASFGGVVGSFVGGAYVFEKMGSALVDMKKRTGLGVEALGGLKYAAEQSGSSLQAVEGGVRVLSRKVAAGDQAFAKLGLSVDDLRKMSPEKQFYAVAEALDRVTDPTQKSALAMATLGKGATELLPMMEGGANGLRKMHDEAVALGLVMTTAEANSADAFGDALGTLWSQLKMVSAMIGSAVAPLLTDLLKKSQPVIASVVAWIRANRPLLANLFAVAATLAGLGGGLLGIGASLKVTAIAIGPLISGFRLFAGATNLAIKGGSMLVKILGSAVMPILRMVGATLLGVGKAIVAFMVQGAAAGVSALGGALGMLLTPIGLVGAAIVGLGGYVLYASGVFGALLQAGTTVWNGLKQTALTAWGAIGEALANGDIVAAGKVAWSALVLEWTRGTNAFKNVWTNFSSFLQAVFAEASANLAKSLIYAWAGLQTAWQETSDFIMDAAAIVWSFLKQGWNSAIGFIQKAWVRFKGLFDADIDVDAEVARINAETDDKNAAAVQARNAAVAERDRKRKAGLAAIDQDLAANLDSIERSRAAKLAKIEGDKNTTLAERERALAEATREFAAAAAAARASAQPASDDETSRDYSTETMDASAAVRDRVAGTFSSLADRMFAFDQEDDAQERAAKAAEKSEQHLSSIRRNGVTVQMSYA